MFTATLSIKNQFRRHFPVIAAYLCLFHRIQTRENAVLIFWVVQYEFSGWFVRAPGILSVTVC